MQCCGPEIRTAVWASNEHDMLYTCRGRLVRPEGFEEYVTTLTFIKKKTDLDLLPACDTVISLCADFDLDDSDTGLPVERLMRLDQCYLFQMKVSKAQCVPAYPEVLQFEML